MKRCHACGKEQLDGTKVSRRDVCPHCRADLRCCLNCTFHDASVSKQCREPLAELIREKEKANFCDYFHFSEKIGTQQACVDRSRKALEELFKK